MQRGADAAGPSGRATPLHSAAELQAAWQLLSGDSPEGVAKRDVQKALRALQPGLTGGEVEAALGGMRQRMTLPRLQALLHSAPLPKDFDAVLAAFRLIDRNHSGTITEEEIVEVVARLPGIGTVRPLRRPSGRSLAPAPARAPCDGQSGAQVEAEDRSVVMQLLDRDRDGIVSLQEFRDFLAATLAQPPPEAEAGLAAAM